LHHTVTHCNTTHTHCNTEYINPELQTLKTVSVDSRSQPHSFPRQVIISGAVARKSTATHCNAPQHTTTNCDTLQHTATHRNTLQHTATHCNTLQYIFETVVRAETSTSTLDLTHTATHCNTLQHIATQPTHTATHCNTTQICTQPLYLYLTVRPKLGSQSHTNLSHVLQHCVTHCNRP